MPAKPSIDAFADAQRTRLTKSLEAEFGSLSLKQLGQRVGDIEAWTLAYLRQSLWELAPIVIGCAKCAQPDHIVKEDSGAVYEISVGREVQAPRNLVVAFLQQRVRKTRPPSARQFRVANDGPFHGVTLLLPEPLRHCSDSLESLTTAVLDGSAEWINQSIYSVIARYENRLARRLYASLRKSVTADAVLGDLWFACVTGGYGFRLLDPKAARQATRVFHANDFMHGHSANRMLAELISTRLPCDGLLMNLARRAHQAIDGDMRLARYRREGSIYADVLAGLYGKDSFSILPVLVHADFAVFVLTPIERRLVVESLLEKQKQKLSILIQDAMSGIVEAEAAFDMVVSDRQAPASSKSVALPREPSPGTLRVVERQRTLVIDGHSVKLGTSHFALLAVLANSYASEDDDAKHLEVLLSLTQKLKEWQRSYPRWFNEKTRSLVVTLEKDVTQANTDSLSKLLNDLRRRLTGSTDPGCKLLVTILPRGRGCNLKLPKACITFA